MSQFDSAHVGVVGHAFFDQLLWRVHHDGTFKNKTFFFFVGAEAFNLDFLLLLRQDKLVLLLELCALGHVVTAVSALHVDDVVSVVLCSSWQVDFLRHRFAFVKL